MCLGATLLPPQELSGRGADPTAMGQHPHAPKDSALSPRSAGSSPALQTCCSQLDAGHSRSVPVRLQPPRLLWLPEYFP